MENRETLLQEKYVRDEAGPWRVLVTCLTLNQTTWKQAEPALEAIFSRWPNPIEMFTAMESIDEAERLKEILRPLGLVNIRMTNILRLCDWYISLHYVLGEKWDLYGVTSCPGCGQYADDAWTLFVLKKPCKPQDKRLRYYAEKVGLYK